MNEEAFPKFIVGAHENLRFVVHLHKPRFVAEVLVNGAWRNGNFKLQPTFLDEEPTEEIGKQLMVAACKYYLSTLDLAPRPERLATVRSKKI